MTGLVIKIHGSVDDKEVMAITLKQVASQVLTKGRSAIIKNVFAKGYHKSVLILGYSSSDIFDLSPQIQAISENQKKVIYVQHINFSDNPNVEDIKEQKEKNPFKKYKNSIRLYYETSELLKKICKSIIDKN